MSHRIDALSLRRAVAPEIVEIAKAIARGLARDECDRLQVERTNHQSIRQVKTRTYSEWLLEKRL